jgi:GDP-L-fucose synthase
MINKDKVFITGKTGTVGSNIEFGFGSRCDLKDFKKVVRVIKNHSPDAIIHCASKVPSVGVSNKDRYSFFYDNLLINGNVIEAARQCGIPRIISILSTWMFQDGSISSESKISKINTLMPTYLPYGYSKRILEVHSRICYECFDLKYNSVLPTNVYGINDNFSLTNGHVIASLIHRAYKSKKEDIPFVVWGDGSQCREFLFASDLAVIIEWVMDNYLEKEPLIVSNHSKTSIKQVAAIIADYMGVSNRLVFDDRKPIGRKNITTNDRKLDKLFSFKFTSIELGIAKTIDWFLANYPNVRR